MRSRLFVCAALCSMSLLPCWSRAARAADPKTKTKSKKSSSTDSLSDDKVISKQLQWEDSVMGPDDKAAELQKIARAQAINKAAAERAQREREKAAAAAAKEPASAPRAQTAKRGGDVALPTMPDEEDARASKSKSSEVSPQLEAAASPPPVKHGDDKFIDKLLKDEPSSKKHAATADDKALSDLLATEKPKAAPKARGKRSDDVDALLDSADKAPPMPETHVKHDTPEWAKPEISSSPAIASPMVLRAPAKKNDGIIHVVQGAASANPTPASMRTSSAAARSSAPLVAPSRKPPAAGGASGGWNDPFADSSPKKTVAARESRALDDDVASRTTAARRGSAAAGSHARVDRSDSEWNDPFQGAPKAAPSARRTTPAAKSSKAPARGGAWKDPFTENRPTARSHAAVAVHQANRHGAGRKSDAGGRHGRPVVAVADEAPARSSRAGWVSLKKR
jgi:hypothetical protein